MSDDDNAASMMLMLLCPTAKLLQLTLDGFSTEAALLIAADTGLVLHANPAARQILSPDATFGGAGATTTTTARNVRELLQFSSVPLGSSSWEEILRLGSKRTLENVTVKVENAAEGESSLPNSESLTCRLTKLGCCTCCSREFVCLYLASTTTQNSTDQQCLKSSCLRDAVDAAFDPMFILSETGVIEMANQAAVITFGYEYPELVGSNISLVCDEEHGRHHDEYMNNYLQSGTAKVIGQQRIVQARRRDGSTFPVELGVKEGNRYFCGFLKDVSAQIKHEEELQERESLLQSIIDCSFEPMFEIDEEGIIRVVNAAATHMFGWTRDEFIGNNIRMICGGDHGPKHDQYLRHYLKTGEKRVIGRKRQVQAKRKDGSEFEIELGIQEVSLSEARRAFCGYVRDLTQEKLDKQALRKTAEVIHGTFFGNKDEDSL